MKKILFLVFILLGLLVTSCTKQVLDKQPLDSYTDNNVWGDMNLAEAFANNLYNILPNPEHNWDKTSNRTWALSSACDEAYNKFNDYNAVVMNAGNLSPDNIGIFDIWQREYSYIQNCNIFLSKIDKVPGDPDTRNRLKGEVMYLRAYAYFMLIRDYGGVPLITQPFDLNSNFSVPRSSFDDCANFIVGECDTAKTLLPINYGPGSANWGRATGAAAMALKTDVLLFDASPQWNLNNDTKRWQKASDAAKAIIDLGIFHLYTGNYDQLFVVPNSEIIMARGINKKNMWNAFEGVEMFLSPSGFHGWASFAPSQNLVDAFNTADGKYISDPTSGYNPQNPYVNRDPRFYADIIYNGRPYGNPAFFQDRYAAGHTNRAEFYEGGLDSPEGWDTWNCSLTRYAFRKYQDTTFNFNVETQTNHFWIISRLAEIYLNYAEAQYHLGNYATAVQYLNKIRSRAGIKVPLSTSLAGTALLKRIYNERQVELCLEGYRYYDVRRWKIADSTENKPLMGVVIHKKADGSFNYTYQKVQDRVFYPKDYLLPIPRDEMLRTKLKQNPGYN